MNDDEEIPPEICKICGAEYYESSIMPYPISGIAKGFQLIEVKINKQSQKTIPNKAGEWIIDLANFPSAEEIYEKIYTNCHDCHWNIKIKGIF